MNTCIRGALTNPGMGTRFFQKKRAQGRSSTVREREGGTTAILKRGFFSLLGKTRKKTTPRFFRKEKAR